MRNHMLLTAFYSEVWAILPGKLAEIEAVLIRHASGERLPQDEIDAITAAATRPAARASGAVAVIPIHGTIIPHGDALLESSGAISTTRIAAMFRQAQADAQVGSIVLDIASPGGAVSGVEELAQEIYQARGGKPVVAVANHLMASAAYFIGSAADEVVVSPSSEVGSIGVFAAHTDMSRAMDAAGMTTTLIQAGKYKTEGNPYQPLTDEGKAAIQARVDEYYNSFVKAVARARGVGVSDVRDGFGQGRVVGAREAVSAGMADRMATLDETIARLSSGRAVVGGRSPAAMTDMELRQRRLRLAEHS